MRSARRVTAQDVADLAGVSRSSVSLVLNGRAEGNVSLERQKAILEAARQLDYHPDLLALGLRSQTSMTLGVLTRRGRSGFPQPMLLSAWTAARDAGYATLLMDISAGADECRKAIRTLLDRRVDGILVITPELDVVEIPDSIQSVPICLVNCADPEHLLSNARPDEFGAAETAARLLIDSGHIRIAVLAAGPITVQMHDRVAGVQQAMTNARLPLAVIHSGPGTAAAGVRLTSQVLESDAGVTAFICMAERLALGVLLAAQQQGLTVPDDLSVISLDDGEFLTADLTPQIATMIRPDMEMAAEGVGLLLSAVRNPESYPVRQLLFAFEPSLGSSIGPPRISAADQSQCG